MTSKGPFLPLSDVCDIKNGGTPDTKNGLFWDGDHAWVTPAEMGKLQSPYLGETRRKLTDAGLASCTAQLLPPRSVILSSRAPIGHLVINEVPMATNQGCKGLIPSSALDYKYLYYFLAASRELLNELGSGTTFAELSMTKLKEVQIPLPPLDEQKRIVAKLDAAQQEFDRLNNNLEQQLSQLADFDSVLLSEMLKTPGQNPELPVTIKWPTKSLDELCNLGILQLGRGNIISKKDIAVSPGDYPIYSSAHQNNGMFGKYGKYMFDEEMITWSIDGGGRLFYRDKHKFSVTNVGGILRVLDPKVFHARFLYFALSDLHSRVRFDWILKAHPSVIRKVYHAVPIPPLDEQKRMVAKLDEASAQTTLLRSNILDRKRSSSELQSSILAAAFAGEL